MTYWEALKQTITWLDVLSLVIPLVGLVYLFFFSRHDNQSQRNKSVPHRYKSASDVNHKEGDGDGEGTESKAKKR